jgi:hypothetical protein
VRQWLAKRPEGTELLKRFGRIDEEVYAALEPFEERIWDIPGLGEEP